jgi:hypothetical protein
MIHMHVYMCMCMCCRWGLAEEDEYEYRRLQALLDDAIASGPADDDEPVGPRESQPYRVRASLGAMGAGQWCVRCRDAQPPAAPAEGQAHTRDAVAAVA